MFIDTSPPDNRSEISLPSSASSSSRSAFPPPSPAKHRHSPSQFSSWPTRTKAKVSDPTANSNNDDDQHQGVDPRALVGTTIVRVKRSAQHPATTLTTSDGRAFQLRVDGYSPAYARMPRTLETNAPALFPGPGGGERAVHLTVTDARRVRMKDTAVARDEGGKDSRWTVVHAAIALKFEEEDGWHAVWASVEEVAEGGACVYRTYDDVYLDEVTKKKGKGKGTWKGKGTRGWGGT